MELSEVAILKDLFHFETTQEMLKHNGGGGVIKTLQLDLFFIFSFREDINNKLSISGRIKKRGFFQVT